MSDISKTLMLLGIVIFIFGVVLYFFAKIPGMGRLPGDILVKKENFTFYFPLTTSIIISIFLSLLFYLWNRK